MKDLKDRGAAAHHGTSRTSWRRDPIQAEKLLDLFLTERFGKHQHLHDSIAVRVCHRMAAVDLARARGIANRLHDAHHKAHAYAVMAQAIAGKDRKEAAALLEQPSRCWLTTLPPAKINSTTPTISHSRALMIPVRRRSIRV